MICANCGKPQSEHPQIEHYVFVPGLPRICPTSVFLAKPEPMKAKPGVWYWRGGLSYEYAFGTASGMLRSSPDVGDEFAMWPDWKEVEP